VNLVGIIYQNRVDVYQIYCKFALFQAPTAM